MATSSSGPRLRAEFVCGTQYVAGCGAQQNAAGAVRVLSGCQSHGQSFLSPTDMWVRVCAATGIGLSTFPTLALKRVLGFRHERHRTCRSIDGRNDRQF